MDQCPFCRYAAEVENDLIALRTPSVLVVPALKQRRSNRGHMLVVPTTHVTRLIDVDRALLAELYSVAAHVSVAVRQAFGASGWLMFQNETIPDQVLHHIHIHVVPRHKDDDFKLPDPTAEIVSREERQQQALNFRRVLN